MATIKQRICYFTAECFAIRRHSNCCPSVFARRFMLVLVFVRARFRVRFFCRARFSVRPLSPARVCLVFVLFEFGSACLFHFPHSGRSVSIRLRPSSSGAAQQAISLRAWRFSPLDFDCGSLSLRSPVSCWLFLSPALFRSLPVCFLLASGSRSR